MPLTGYGQKLMLDWLLSGGGAGNAQKWISYATGVPNASYASDGGQFSTRFTLTLAAANSPQGSKTNLNAISCIATAIASVTGWNLYDSGQGGTRLAYGTTTAVIGCASGDGCRLQAGTLKITLL